jgi:uncharacterized Ntn-hydrolase superfamily protein
VFIQAGTFSIVAADPTTGEVGCAVQSRYFAIGAVTPWVRAGVGAVATQAMGVVARNGERALSASQRRLIRLRRSIRRSPRTMIANSAS